VLGVPQHLPPELKVKAVHLRAAPARLDPDARLDAEDKAAFDAVWLTPDLPARDYCAEMQNLRQQPDAK